MTLGEMTVKQLINFCQSQSGCNECPFIGDDFECDFTRTVPCDYDESRVVDGGNSEPA